MFTVVSVCFKNLDELIATYESLILQSYDDYEWLVVDGSESAVIADWVAGLSSVPFSFTLLSKKDSGIYFGMNNGIELATHDYLIFLNSGDKFAGPCVLSDIAGVIDSEKYPDFLYGDAYEYRNKKHYLKRAYSKKHIYYGMITHHQSMVFSRALLEKNGLRYNVEYRYAADYDFVAEFVKIAQSFSKLAFPVSIFDCSGVSFTNYTASLQEANSIRKKRFGFFVYAICIILKKVVLFVRFRLSRIYDLLRYS
jgi:putative colanic acid biosynthesis glycosyltransferase